MNITTGHVYLGSVLSMLTFVKESTDNELDSENKKQKTPGQKQ